MDLMQKCPDCGGSGELSIKYPMIVDFPYANPSLMIDKKVSCTLCLGKGYYITDAGFELLDFLKRFYPREHKHSELMRF